MVGIASESWPERALPVEAARRELGDLLLAGLLHAGERAVGAQRIGDLLLALRLSLHVGKLLGLGVDRVGGQDEGQYAHDGGAEAAQQYVDADPGACAGSCEQRRGAARPESG